MTTYVTLIALSIFPLCMVFATFCDIFTMTIPNKISLLLIGAFAVAAPLAGMEAMTILWHVLTAIGVLVVGFLLFNLGVMGGGDAKLLAASALWFGAFDAISYVLIASIMGGVLTMIILGIRSRTLPSFLLSVDWIFRLHDKKEGVPYGAALGPAALLVFAYSPWMNFLAFGSLVG